MLARYSVLYGVLAIGWCSASRDDISQTANSRNPFQWIEKKVEVQTPIKKAKPDGASSSASSFAKATADKKATADSLRSKTVECFWKLQGISMSSGGSRAMLKLDNHMIVAQEKENVDQQWKVEKINARTVTLKHHNGQIRELTL